MKNDTKISVLPNDELHCPNCGNGKDGIDRLEISPQIYITCCRKCGYTDFLRVISKNSSEKVQKKIDKNVDVTKEKFRNRSVIIDIPVPPDVAELLKLEAEFQKKLYETAADMISNAIKETDKKILKDLEEASKDAKDSNESLSEYLNRKKLEEIRQIVEEESKNYMWDGQKDGPEEPMV